MPALIYTALHPANVSSTMRQIAKHMRPMQIKDLGRVAVVASRTTPTPQPSVSPTPAPSATPAAKVGKATPAELAHLAHLKRARELAAAAAAGHARKLASTGQTSDVSASTSAGTDSSTQPGTTLVPARVGATSPAGVGTDQQPVADATPVYAPEMVVDARFTHEVQPDYPDVAKAQNAQGTAVVLATIGPSGSVISTRIDQSTGNKLLDQAALTAARLSTFEPPKINGKPATETYRLVYTFAL
ncbi:MAG: TonB family protein [Candidatus Eremiobacteraeota bacterium]|nr:TonB family protein [Candidatus Eremiobacteraeota bacterium]